MSKPQRERLRQRLANLETEEARTTGAIEQLLKQLKTEFSCKTLKDAKKKLEEIQNAFEEAQALEDVKFEEFEEEYKKTLPY